MHAKYLYAKELNEPKCQFLIKKREDVGINHLNDPKAFIEYSQYTDDFHNNIDDYSPNRNSMIADIMTNKIFQTIIK